MLLEILFIFSAVLQQLHAQDQNMQIADFVGKRIKDLKSQSSETRDVVVVRFDNQSCARRESSCRSCFQCCLQRHKHEGGGGGYHR
jgi:hypothetical protein